VWHDTDMNPSRSSQLALAVLGCLLALLTRAQAHAYTHAGNDTFAARWNEWGRYKVGAQTIYPAEHHGLWEYDVSEDWDFNIIDPSDAIRNHHLNLDPVGPHAGACVVNNPKVLAMGDGRWAMGDGR
jgi:hypothetical protein